jgi:hypothetical protein
MRKDESIQLSRSLVCSAKEHDAALRTRPPNQQVRRARENGVRKNLRLDAGAKTLGKSAHECCG